VSLKQRGEMKKTDSVTQKTARLKKALTKTSFAAQHIMQMQAEWAALLDNKKITYSLSPLLYALAIRYPELNALAAEQLESAMLPDYSKSPLQSDSTLSIIGNSGLTKTEIKNILKESEVKYSTVPEKSTHLLVGRSLSESDLALLLELREGRTLLNERIFFDFCSAIRSFDTDNPDAIRQLMLHEDDINVEIALELMKSTASPKDFISEILGIFIISKKEDLITKAEKLLKVYGSAQLKSRLSKIKKDALNSNFDEWLTEAGINVGHFYRLAYLKDPRHISYFNKAVQLLKADELDHFLNNAIRCWAFSAKPQHISVPSDVDFERFAPKIYQCYGLKELTVNIQNYNFLKKLPPGIAALSELESLIITPSLAEFPLELQKLPNLKSLFINTVQMTNLDNVFNRGFEKLEYLKLHLCRMERLPKGIGNLKSLRVLDLNGGDLKELSPEISQLKNLKELNIDNNKFREMPEILYLMSELKKLKMKNRWSDQEQRNIETLKMSLSDCEIII
jgi:Leucine-rich repeat (LRR) protein